MKPNMAGLMIVGGVTLLFITTKHKVRLVMLTLGAAVAALTVLALNHVPAGAMLSSYLSVGKERGGIRARFAYRLMSQFEKHSALFWISVLAVPLLGALPKGAAQLWHKDWRAVASTLLFPLSLLMAIYGLATNGEFRDAECTAMLAAGGVIAFGLRWSGTFLRRITIAILCASIAGDLYYGAARTYVFASGEHYFFDWQDNQHPIDSGFLKNMRVSAQLVEVEREIKQALDANPGPYFLGPRIDFNYAVFGLRSPDGFPVWWHPGTSFPRTTEPQVLQHWQEHRFATLIFAKDRPVGPGRMSDMAYTYYTPEFLDILHRAYVRDDESYPDITVYRLRGGVDSTAGNGESGRRHGTELPLPRN